jgi:hypothetical protein
MVRHWNGTALGQAGVIGTSLLAAKGAPSLLVMTAGLIAAALLGTLALIAVMSSMPERRAAAFDVLALLLNTTRDGKRVLRGEVEKQPHGDAV